MRPPIRVPAIAAAGLWVLFAAGCAELILGERVDSTHLALQRHPGAVEAAAYAEALHEAGQQQVYRADSTEFQRRANEALVALGASEGTAGPDRPRLVAWRGLLLLDLRRNDEARVELEKSMAMRPTLIAARGLVPMLHGQGRTDAVGQTCAAGAASITERDELFGLMQLCAANMNAGDEATALSWATPELRAFYDAERARRQREAREAAEREALEDAQHASQALMDQMAAAQAAADFANQIAMQAAMQAAQMATPPAP
jgi:hypothetical protein